MNRRSFIKKGLGSLMALLGIGGGSFFYAMEIEPFKLHIKKETLTSSKIPKSFHNFKIVQFSDTHIGFHYTLKQLNELITIIHSQQPDLIVFTGDLVDEPNEYKDYNQLQETLRTLQAPYGKYWIYGNHDHGGYGTDIIREVMEASEFTLLQNSVTTIEKLQEKIVIAGIDDVMLGKPNLDQTFQHVEPSLYTILLAHEPDIAEKASQFPVDVQLSGHSHGGQVRLPFIGHLYTPLYAEKYVKGKYTVDQLTLFVNSGIGTTRLPYRFLCEPEIHIYTLQSTNKS